MHIFCWGTYDTGKPRTRLLLKGLRANGAEVVECHADIWNGVEDKSQLRGTWRRFRIILHWIFSYPRLGWRLLRAPRPDVLLIGFPGIWDILIAAPIARLRGIPLVWDMFMSTYDTIVEDRRLLRKGSTAARLLHSLEKFALRRADFVFLDTQAHARRVEKLFQADCGSIGAVWVGAEMEYFNHHEIMPTHRQDEATPLRVLFYGQFIPLHGIETIVHAARLTRDEPFEWHLVGKGQQAEYIQSMLEHDPLPKLRWDDWIDYEDLFRAIAHADVCLGIFGTSDKASSVIPNKVFQAIAMGKPIITRDSPAIREILDGTPPCSYLVTPGDPASLAEAVRDICVRKSASSCHTALQGKVSAEAIGRQCITLLAQCLDLEN